MTGEVAILSVGAGDTKLTFDNKNPAETIRAARIVKDMLRRGYALLVEVDQPDGGKAYQRAIDFDDTKNEYVIADFDPSFTTIGEEKSGPMITETASEEAGKTSGDSKTSSSTAAQPSSKPRTGKSRRRLPASGTRAVAVARTAGG